MWVSATKIRFETDFNCPKATEYKIVVPAGIKSASGAVLEKPYVHIFRSNPPQVICPSGGVFYEHVLGYPLR